MMRRALALICLILPGFAYAQGGAQEGAQGGAQQVIIGTADTYPPFIVHDGTPPVSGMEGELLALICARAGWSCRWEIMAFDRLFPALEAGRIDIAASSLGSTPERQARVHMTCPHRPADSDELQGNFYSLDPNIDPRSGVIAVMGDTLHASALSAAGHTTRLFPSDTAALDAVVAGEVPAYFGPSPAVGLYPNRARLSDAGTMMLSSGGTSLAVSRTRPDIIAGLDDQLVALSRDGIITALLLQWTGDSVEDPIALCDIQLPVS